MRCHDGVNSGNTWQCYHMLEFGCARVTGNQTQQLQLTSPNCYIKTCPARENPVLIACLHFLALLRKECVGVASSYESTSGSFTYKHTGCYIGSMSMRSGGSQVYNWQSVTLMVYAFYYEWHHHYHIIAIFGILVCDKRKIMADCLCYIMPF